MHMASWPTEMGVRDSALSAEDDPLLMEQDKG